MSTLPHQIRLRLHDLPSALLVGLSTVTSTQGLVDLTRHLCGHRRPPLYVFEIGDRGSHRVSIVQFPPQIRHLRA
jgi:hypothetical protein